MASNFHNKWKPEEIAVLGTMPDRDAARLMGRTYRATNAQRCLLGIPAFKETFIPIRIARLNAHVVHIKGGAHGLVDPEDWSIAASHMWSSSHGYAAAAYREDGKWAHLRLHRLICPTPLHVDHVNRNPLDNRRCNLRPATRSQNLANRTNQGGGSHYKGVSWSKRSRKWQARITVQRKLVYSDYFPTELDAAKAYDTEVVKHFGEFSVKNFS